MPSNPPPFFKAREDDYPSHVRHSCLAVHAVPEFFA